ncbi:G protein-coupled glucose receptor regulating Gpa2-domain-containing protein [Elsinoe ampelina]|uniref:G protein-coupled glucose receptor regulating Gpa2-domain-containing protein n=1 Tax=Elsinoe ampelina TaxID=302913 RepID=A0A6A6GR70_9PEZI|nr:G protein-coupled glucose receptor regulating Gpa2-domain-containing protein [Elsinoe ampelina]
MGLGGHNLDTNALLSQQQKIIIQHVSIGVASLSVAACLLSIYWFLLMRRNFRRTLVMLLLFSDLFKSSWFMVFPAVSLKVGGILSGSRFCDVGGFFLQAGIESCDVAILMMSIHMSLQVFNPTSGRIGPDGLYRYRNAVYAIWIFLPSFMAGLAFVRQGQGSYLSQGAFCTLPIRPFWYRLALSWIPRYLVLAYITVTAIRIYLHVGAGFTVFAREVDSASRTEPSTVDRSVSRRSMVVPQMRRAASYVSEHIPVPFLQHPEPARRPSDGYHQEDDSQEGYSMQSSPTKTSHKPSRDSLSPDAAAQMVSHFQRPRQGSHMTNMTAMTTASSNVIDYGAAQILPGSTASGGPLVNIISTADCTANARRRAIQRQTRLLFIYPCVYMIFMVIPFVQHCFTYSDYFAQHPVFAIQILAPICYAIMGFADCMVFCWREKPWTNIPGSNGTFWGSFCWWRFIGPWADRSPTPSSREFRVAVRAIQKREMEIGPKGEGTLEGNPSDSTLQASHPTFELTDYDNRPGSSGSTTKKFLKTIKVIRPSNRRAFSGHSDQAALAAERAAERLALERAAHTQRRSFLAEKGHGETGKREWFDQLVDEEEGEEEEEEGYDESEAGSEEEGAKLERKDTQREREEREQKRLADEREKRMRDFGAM